MAYLFSYGTLQQLDVQLASYGHKLLGRPDTLTGYRLQRLAITDSDVVAISGKAVYTIACWTGDRGHKISGTVFDMTDDELRATDRYEVDAYRRIEVALESGTVAWIYVGHSQLSP